MLKERERLVRRGMMVLDGLVVAIAFLVAYFLRVHFHIFYKMDLVSSGQIIGMPASLDLYMSVLFLSVPLWVLMLSLNGLYRSFRTRPFYEIVGIIIKSVLISALSFGGLAFILKIHFVSRVFFVIFIGTSISFLIFEKLDSPQGRAFVYHTLGDVHLARGDSSISLDMYDKAMALYIKLTDIQSHAYTLHKKAEVLRRLKRIDEALPLYESAISKLEKCRKNPFTFSF